jgi:hypothetical protein
MSADSLKTFIDTLTRLDGPFRVEAGSDNHPYPFWARPLGGNGRSFTIQYKSIREHNDQLKDWVLQTFGVPGELYHFETDEYHLPVYRFRLEEHQMMFILRAS